MATGLATFLNSLDAEVISAIATHLDIELDPSAESKQSALDAKLEDGSESQTAFVLRLRKRVQKIIRPDCIQHVYAAMDEHPGKHPPAFKNSASRIAWLYLKAIDVFQEAEYLLEHSRWQGKEDHWTGFIIDETVYLPASFDCSSVREKLTSIFRARDGGGDEIIIREFDRPSTVAKRKARHLTIYRSTQPETVGTISGGVIGVQEYTPYKPVNVMIDKSAALFELTAESGGKKYLRDIATVLLGEMQLDPKNLEAATPRKVDLSALKERQFFPASLHDGIISADLIELGFYDAEDAFVRVKLRDSNYDSIWDWAKRRGYAGNLDLAARYVTDAVIEFTFPKRGRERTSKTRRVRLSAATNSFTAPNLDQERRAVIDRLLVQWGLLACP